MTRTVNFAPTALEKALEQWQNHEFYTSAVVLGLDIGLGGIGVYLRKGPEVLYERTLEYHLPQTNALQQRRQYRAARRCRKNRRTRLKRLRSLCEKHGLPWFEGDDDALIRSDPFRLRYRAITGRLASPEALSLCIRHLVTHRGYEYFSDEGEYPWGDEASLADAVKWIRTAYVSPEDAEKLAVEGEVIANLDGGKKAQEKLEEFLALLQDRTVSEENDPVREVLVRYVKEKRNHLRQQARGDAYPRRLVWKHLKTICRRHDHLIDDIDGFLAELGAPRSDKARAIFNYHRKTQGEMKAHWEKKIGTCPYAGELGLSPRLKRGLREDLAVRRFSLLEFLFSRRVQLDDGQLCHLSAEGIGSLLDWLDDFETAYQVKEPLPEARAIRKIVVDDIRARFEAKPSPESKSDINRHFFSQLRDILVPSKSNRKARASMSSEAAEILFERATRAGLERESVNEALQDYFDWRKRAGNDFGLYPQVEFLLGKRRKQRPAEWAVDGKLQRVFQLPEVVEYLDGQTAPDYCVVEVVGDIPRNEKQKRERESEIAKNRKRKEKLFEAYGAGDSEVRSAYRRVLLFDQQGGICPYTGDELRDPLSTELQIDHVFPQDRGGITVTENLVLTYKQHNLAKGKMTPPEAARKVPGWDWATMQRAASRMKWNGKKRAIFEWDEPGIPDFGNLTRTAQLARQLVDEIAHWMGIAGETKEMARRIGTPSGYLRGQAMRSWQERVPQKDRSDLVHHLVDAAIVAHIPPGPGMNQAVYGGIFYPEYDREKDRSRLAALPLGPNLARWMTDEPETCPVVKCRRSSRYGSLHDTTLLSVREDGTLWSRKPMPERGSISDAEALVVMLAATGIPSAKIPSRKALESWLDASEDSPLRLTDGTLVKSILSRNPKGNYRPPFGLTGENPEDSAPREVKIVIEKFDALEIWEGVYPDGPKAGQRVYQKRLVPTRSAMHSLMRFGFSWAKKKAPPQFQKHRDRPDTHQTLREIICGKLLPHSTRRHVFRKGQAYRIGLTRDGDIAGRGQSAYWHCWYQVSALSANTQVEFKAVQFREKDATPLAQLRKNFLTLKPMNADLMAFIAGLPSLDDPPPDTAG